MTGRVTLSGVTEMVLSLEEHVAAVADPAAGATASFSGVVRDHDGGRSVADLEYQSHPTASSIVTEVASEIAGREGIIAVALTHRVGLLHIGDIAVVAAVSSARRKQAFEACAELIEQVKARLPVWKRQVFADGTDEWVGSA